MKNEDTKIIFMGTPEFSVPVLKSLIGSGFKIVAVATNPDEIQGRKKILTSPPVKQFIIQSRLQFEIFQPATKADLSALNYKLSALKPDLIVVAAYGKIIPKEILDIPRLGALNVHPSLLPAWRGASPIQSAILNGDQETGVTIMLMDEEMDHGTILTSCKLPIANDDTYESLSKKLSELGAELLIQTIPDYINGKIKPQAQNHSKATYTKIIKKEDGKIDWSKSALETERMTRAFYPWPGAWAKIKTQNAKIKIANQNEKILKIIKADVLENNGTHKIGEVFLTPGSRPAVRCGDDALIIEKLQLEGGKVLTAQEFLNGHKDFMGSVLK